MSAPVRLGILGASRIAPMAVIGPAGRSPHAEIVAVGARDPERASTFALEHGIPTAHVSYEAVLADPGVDAVYISLPATLNGQWTRAALATGKHVLVEKPMAANSVEARETAALAADTGLTVLQGYHYRYHPFIARIRQLLEQGEIGAVRHLSAWFTVPRPPEWNIRWRYELGGGTLMDHGSYPVHLLRTLAGAEPDVESAIAVAQPDPRNDGTMDARLEFPGGVGATVHASMLGDAFSIGAEIEGDTGTLTVTNFVHPTMGNEIRVTPEQGPVRSEVFASDVATFDYQLQAFVGAVRHGTAFPTDAVDGAANLGVIDGIYRAAGLPVREPLQLAG